MSSSLKQRIFCSLKLGVILYILLSFFIGLFFRSEGWLIFTIKWSISATIGWIVSAIVTEKTVNESESERFFSKCMLVLGLVIIFVTMEILGLSDWDIYIPYTLTVFTNWKKD